MKGIIMHQPQHHRDISKLIDKVYGIIFDLDEILRVERREIYYYNKRVLCQWLSFSHMPSEMMKFSFHFPGFVGLARKEAVHQPLAVLQYCSYTAVLCSQFTQPRLRCHVTETLPVFDTLPPSLNTHTPDKKNLVTFICHCYSTLRRQADNKSKNLSWFWWYSRRGGGTRDFFLKHLMLDRQYIK